MGAALKFETFEQLVARVNRNSFLPPPEKETTMKVLKKKFEFPVKKIAAGPASKYDWDKLFDGQTYVLTRGEDGDYPEPKEGKKDKFPTLVKKAGAKRHKNIEITFVDAEDRPCDEASSVGVVFRASAMTAEQAAESDRRAEASKLAKEAKKAAKKAAEANGTVSEAHTEAASGVPIE